MDFLVLMAACDDRATGCVKHGKGVPAFVEPRHRGAADLVRNPLARLFVERQPHRTMMIESPPPKSLEQVQDERREAALVAADLGVPCHVFHTDVAPWSLYLERTIQHICSSCKYGSSA